MDNNQTNPNIPNIPNINMNSGNNSGMTPNAGPTVPPVMPKIPTMSNIPNMPSQSGHSRKNAWEAALVIIVAIIVIAGILVFLRSSSQKPQMQPQKFSSENVNVSKVDLATATGDARLPVGFPTNIPVELNNISESTTLAYPERGATLYSVSYTSAKQPEEIYTEYGDYLKSNKFNIGINTKTAQQMMYQASTSTTSISVVITPHPGGTMVQIAYVVRTK